MVAVEEIGNPEQVQPPDRIRKELPNHEGPSLPMRQQRPPRDVHRRIGRITVDVRQFRSAQPWVFMRTSIERQPERQPQESQQAGGDKSPVPAPGERDPGNDERRCERTDVGAGVEDPGSERAFALRKPFGRGLDRRGKVSCLSDPEGEPRNHEAGDRRRVREPHQRQHGGGRGTEEGRFGMGDCRKAPQDDRNRESRTDAETVHDPPRHQESCGVGELKGEDDVGVVEFRPAELVLESRLQDPDDLPVDVVDRRREKQQRADDPAQVPRGSSGSFSCGG